MIGPAEFRQYEEETRTHTLSGKKQFCTVLTCSQKEDPRYVPAEKIHSRDDVRKATHERNLVAVQARS